MKILAILAALLGAWPGLAAAAWWNDDWAFRKELKFDLTPAGADVPGSPSDVPLLIRLHPGNFSYFGDVLPDGADLRFVAADDITPLSFHIERFDAVNQLALIWVRIPRLTGGTNTDFVYLYYGNPDAAPAGDAAGTYDANQVLVYHFSEANGIASDATAYGNAPAEFSAELASASLIAGGARFSGSSAIVVADSPSTRIVPEQGITVTLWARIDEPQQQAYLFAAEDPAGPGLVLGIDGQTAFVRLTDSAGVAAPLSGAELRLGEWTHLAMRAGDGRLNLFVNGEDVAGIDAELPEIAATMAVGGSASGQNAFVGEIDELGIARATRSADWITAAAASQSAFGTLLSYGADAQQEGGHSESYFAITLRNVTVDGWVVIFILGIMFVISLLVMFFKAMLLSRVERQNRRFLAEYRGIGADDPLALMQKAANGTDDAGDDNSLMAGVGSSGGFRPSTLFPLYLAGVAEVRHRVGSASPAVGAQRRGFTAETIGAIRATVDAQLVRERQKLNSKMVLLTIAISGGPFLGLLGTVVGVMITFAAIAASGDVNVNAIAPGIAAALAATVAGLVVAIPALFGYNWLGARIKDIDAETHVFADEFVNKLAEHYV